MRCGKVELINDSGVRTMVEASGDGEIVIEPHIDKGFVLLRDTGLPPHDLPANAPAGSVPGGRIVGQIPFTWAVFPHWEFTAPWPRPSTQDDEFTGLETDVPSVPKLEDFPLLDINGDEVRGEHAKPLNGEEKTL